MTTIWKLDGKILMTDGKIAVSDACCCGEPPPPSVAIAINICNANKWSDTARDVVINGHTATAPTNQVNTACGGGFYTNATPTPGYCSLGFTCCGLQVGGTLADCPGCAGGPYTGHTYTPGAYPATGCKGEDCGCAPGGGESNFQVCGTYGDCGGDLTTQVFDTAWLNIGGSNTVSSSLAATGRCSGDYGVWQIWKLQYVSGSWIYDSTIIDTTYGSSTISTTFSL